MIKIDFERSTGWDEDEKQVSSSLKETVKDETQQVYLSKSIL